MSAQWWMVCSAVYGEVVPVTDDGQGPMEYGRLVVYVTAATKREAARLGVATMRRAARRAFEKCYEDGNPFAGLLVEPMGRRRPQ